jgi:hypothetical protein
MPSVLKQSDYEPCLIRLYFGRGEDWLSLCLHRAYGDFKRTLRGIGKLRRAKDARNEADKTLSRMLAEIQGMETVTQKKFDRWHRAACEKLKVIYKKFGYRAFHVGHAQKWLNMALKYAFVMGEQRIPGFHHLYDFCHVR